jgi:hypothetical protein
LKRRMPPFNANGEAFPRVPPWASAWEERLAVPSAGIELFLEVDSVKIFGEPFRAWARRTEANGVVTGGG